MAGIRFGVRIPFTGPASTSRRLREAAQIAEEAGFDAVLAQDHIHKTFARHPQNPMASGSVNEPSNTREPVILESLTSFAYLMGVTERLTFITAVTPLPLREPIITAKQLATISAHGRGRLIFGVGVANKTDRDEFDAMGVPFRPYAERYEQASEYITAMRLIWDEREASYAGQHIRFERLVVYPKPHRHIPIWIGCGSLAGGLERPAVRFALEHANGVIPPAVTSPDEFRTMIADFSDSARASGRDLTDFTWCAQRRVSLGHTVDEAAANVAWMQREQADMWRFVGHLHDRGGHGTALSHSMAAVGTPDDIARNLSLYADEGVGYFGIAFTYPTYENLVAQMRLFGDKVIPVFK
jgi:alkanesulfonate monooxygenase SsuD/methylene tetrahydromethanopterin reductase-like flavin-dependent oxidoreductase (luciferase family)